MLNYEDESCLKNRASDGGVEVMPVRTLAVLPLLAFAAIGSAADIPPTLNSLTERRLPILNDRNRTPHTGNVVRSVWHVKDERYYYYLVDEAGKKISKRYPAEDLQRVEILSNS